MARVEIDHWWYRTLRRLVVARAADAPMASLALLDAGCGTGAGLATWSPLTRAVGLDPSEHALRYCRERLLGPLVQGSVERIPLRARSVHTVVCLDVLCLEGIDEGRALAEIRRVLMPGGTLILNLPAFEQLRGQHDLAVRIRHRYTKRELTELLRQNGFDVAAVSYWNTALFPLVWLVRKFRRASGRSGSTSDLGRPNGIVNAALTWLLGIETSLLGERAPFGTSVFAVARAPGVAFPGVGAVTEPADHGHEAGRGKH